MKIRKKIFGFLNITLLVIFVLILSACSSDSNEDDQTPNNTSKVVDVSITSAPVIEVIVGDEYSYDVETTDVGILSYALTDAPEGMSINAETGLINWTPTLAQVGDQDVTVTVTDNGAPENLSVKQTFKISVVAANEAPVITSTARIVGQVGEAYRYDINATDANSRDVLTYALANALEGMSIDAQTGLINWTPNSARVGDQDVRVTVTDNGTPGNLSVEQTFKISVVAANVTPVITSTAEIVVQVGEAYRYDIDATDANSGDVLTYALANALEGMSIDAQTGLINWVPSSTQVGDQDVRVTVTDDGTPAIC